MSSNISLATSEDKEEILALYKSQLGRPFCMWDEHYPTKEDIDYDLSRDALIIKKDENDRIIAAISIDLDENVNNLSCWSSELAPGGELSRLAVSIDYQNRGIAREMLVYGMQELKRRSYKSIHFLVNKDNIKAIKSYEHLDFNKVGDCYLYEQSFWCYEKLL